MDCGECLLRFGFGVGCFALLFVYRFAVYAVLVDCDFGVGCGFMVLVVLVGAGGVCCLLISLWVGGGVSLLHV